MTSEEFARLYVLQRRVATGSVTTFEGRRTADAGAVHVHWLGTGDADDTRRLVERLLALPGPGFDESEILDVDGSTLAVTPLLRDFVSLEHSMAAAEPSPADVGNRTVPSEPIRGAVPTSPSPPAREKRPPPRTEAGEFTRAFAALRSQEAPSEQSEARVELPVRPRVPRQHSESITPPLADAAEEFTGRFWLAGPPGAGEPTETNARTEARTDHAPRAVSETNLAADQPRARDEPSAPAVADPAFVSPLIRSSLPGAAFGESPFAEQPLDRRLSDTPLLGELSRWGAGEATDLVRLPHGASGDPAERLAHPAPDGGAPMVPRMRTERLEAEDAAHVEESFAGVGGVAWTGEYARTMARRRTPPLGGADRARNGAFQPAASPDPVDPRGRRSLVPVILVVAAALLAVVVVLAYVAIQSARTGTRTAPGDSARPRSAPTTQPPSISSRLVTEYDDQLEACSRQIVRHVRGQAPDLTDLVPRRAA